MDTSNFSLGFDLNLEDDLDSFDFLEDTNDFDWGVSEDGDTAREIEDEDMLRSTIAMEEAWFKGKDTYSIDDMCEHLEALLKVVDRKSTYADFITETNINSKIYIN